MKKVVVFLADGFEEIEALTVVDVLRRAKVSCDTCSIHNKSVNGAHNMSVQADKLIEDINPLEYDAVILPGGMPGSTNLRDNEKVIDIVKIFNDNNKIIGAICAAPIVLAKALDLKGRKITSYPGVNNELGDCLYKEELVVEDDNIITSRGPATALYFALKLVEKLTSKDIKEKLKEGMLVNLIEK